MRKNATLNIWVNDYLPLRYPSNWWGNIKIFFRKFKYSYQRIKYGYSERDTWSLDNYLNNLIAESVYHLAENSHGYPGDETPEGSSPEAWENYLKTAANLLLKSTNEDNYPNKYSDVMDKAFEKATFENGTINWNFNQEEEEIEKKWYERTKEIWVEQQKDWNVAFDMLRTHWSALWD